MSDHRSACTAVSLLFTREHGLPALAYTLTGFAFFALAVFL